MVKTNSYFERKNSKKAVIHCKKFPYIIAYIVLGIYLNLLHCYYYLLIFNYIFIVLNGSLCFDCNIFFLLITLFKNFSSILNLQTIFYKNYILYLILYDKAILAQYWTNIDKQDLANLMEIKLIFGQYWRFIINISNLMTFLPKDWVYVEIFPAKWRFYTNIDFALETFPTKRRHCTNIVFMLKILSKKLRYYTNIGILLSNISAVLVILHINW